MKYPGAAGWGLSSRPAPYGAGGLKFPAMMPEKRAFSESRPVWGGWIEMLLGVSQSDKDKEVPPRMGRVD